KQHKKGKRIALKGKFVFSTQEVLKLRSKLSLKQLRRSQIRMLNSELRIYHLEKLKKRLWRLYLAILIATVSLWRLQGRLEVDKTEIHDQLRGVISFPIVYVIISKGQYILLYS
ncbi:hypothetical protein M433DRAFT_75384, partial [Acidomyces richmondensis BFW]